MTDAYPIRAASAEKLRQVFNDGHYWERALAGDLHQVVRDRRHPTLPLANEPFCTWSQIVSYRDHGDNEVARVHQYLRPNGTIGLSGRPDPKKVLSDGIIYQFDPGVSPGC